MKKQMVSILLILGVLLAIIPVSVRGENIVGVVEPTLISLDVQDSTGNTISLLDNGGTSISLGDAYTFKASFSDSELIHNVFITSTKGREKAILDTYYDKNENAYISTGYFNGDNTYIPGKIGVEYTKNIDMVEINDNVDWTSLQSALGDNCTTTVNSASGETVQATVDISKLLNSEKDVAIDLTLDVFDEKTGENLGEWLGYYRDLESMQHHIIDGNYFLYLDDMDMASKVIMVVHDVSNSKYTKLVLNEAKDYNKSWGKIADDLENVALISGIVSDYLDIADSTEKLRSEIEENASFSQSQKMQLSTELDEYYNDRVAFTLLVSTLPVLVAATGGAMAGPAIIFNALLSTIKSASDTFWDYRVGTIKGCEPIDVSFSGSASCGTPLTRDYLLDNHITESGHYCISESAISIVIGEDGTPVDVTLCLHGKDANFINVASGSTLHLCDCTYVGCIENQHGTVSGGHVDSVGMKSNSRLFFESGVIGNGIYGNRINCDGAEIHMTGGTITDGIVGQNNSKVFIYGGDI